MMHKDNLPSFLKEQVIDSLKSFLGKFQMFVFFLDCFVPMKDKIMEKLL